MDIQQTKSLSTDIIADRSYDYMKITTTTATIPTKKKCLQQINIYVKHENNFDSNRLDRENFKF